MMEIFIKTSFSGIHNWPDAPPNRNYLRSLHRHEFHVEAVAEIDEDREIEFHDLLEEVERVINDHIGEPISDGPLKFLGPLSCERIGRRIMRMVPCISEITVSEDNECGSTITREG